MRCFGQQRAFEWAGGCWPAPHIFHAADPDDRAARRGARDWLGVCDREVGSRHDNMFFILQSSPCPLYKGASENSYSTIFGEPFYFPLFFLFHIGHFQDGAI